MTERVPLFSRLLGRAPLAVAAVLLVLVLGHPIASAEDNVSQRATSDLSASWSLTLDAAEAYIGQIDSTPEETTYFLEQARRVDKEVDFVTANALARIEKIDELLATIDDERRGETVDQVVIDQARADLELERSDRLNRLAIAAIMNDRAERVVQELASDEWLASGLWTRSSFSPSLSTFTQAIPAAGSIVASILRSPLIWISEFDQQPIAEEETVVGLLGLIVTLGLGWIARHFILKRFGRDPAITEPSYSRRFIAALAVGFAGGIIPAFVVGLFLYDLSRTQAILTGDFAAALQGAGYAVTFLFLAFALIRGALSPELTTWKITALTPDSARRLSWRCQVLAVVIAIDIFFTIAGNESSVSPALRAVETFVTTVVEGLVLLSLASPSVWQREASEKQTGAIEDDRGVISHRMWVWIRRATALIVILGLASSILGYIELGSFLIKNMLSTAIVIAIMFLLREVLRETIGLITRSYLMRERLRASHRTRRTVKFWLRLILDPLLIVLTILILANIWGVPFNRLAAWTGEALEGFNVGNVQISLIDVALGLVTFAVVIVVMRLVQTVLQDHILPESGWDEGTQHSVLSVLSYVGFTLATVLGIAVIGVDMTTIGLIAGGLSIGIGLGLQGIVNNFISGIILLIERPVKVGDWVIVGMHEGFVKRVNIRATEIETWQRASVIVPNAELLNTSVTNWTHHDRMGRMEIRLRVPRGTDVDLVQEIMMECAQKHPSVASWPEPSALFMDFGENGLDFELRCFTADNVWVYFIGSDLRFAINRRLREEGIEMALPQRVIRMAENEPPPRAPRDKTDDEAEGADKPSPTT